MRQIALTVALFAGLSACKTNEKRVENVTAPGRAAASVAAEGSFETLVFNAIFDAEIKANANRNIVVSPTSIKLVLGMLAAGAANSDRAQTRDVLGKILGGDQNAVDATLADLEALNKSLKANKFGEINTANGVFSTGGKINPEYAAKMKDSFDALVAPADLVTINEFVKKNTKGLIPKILEKLDANSIAVLVNAVYFKGDWQTIYFKDKAGEFTTAGGKKKVDYAFYVSGSTPVLDKAGYATRVPDQEDKKGKGTKLVLKDSEISLREGYAMISVDGKEVEVLRKPYGKKGESELAMYFVLPPEGTSANSIAKSSIGSTSFWAEVTERMFYTDRDGKQRARTIKLSEVRFPIVKVGSKIDLKQGFEGTKRGGVSLGELFNEANFDPINEAITHVSQATHVTYMAIDEKGTEAAAATAIEVATRSAHMPQSFIVNRPYLVTVMDEKNHEPLFMGVINDPTAPPEK